MKGSDRSTVPPGRGLFVAAAGLGAIALLLLVCSGFGTRLGLWHFRTGFAILKYAGFLGLAALIAGVLATVFAARRKYAGGLLLSFIAIGCGLAAFSVPYLWKLRAQHYPRIHDITTDVGSPPEFVDLVKERGGPVPYGGPSVAMLQLEAYPDLRTVILPVPADRAFKSALDAAREMGWRVVSAAPAGNRIEATDTTFWFGFTDDIVVRITPAAHRSLLDVRSVSRVGISDVGTNAKRIRAFLKKIRRQYPTP